MQLKSEWEEEEKSHIHTHDKGKGKKNEVGDGSKGERLKSNTIRYLTLTVHLTFDRQLHGDCDARLHCLADEYSNIIMNLILHYFFYVFFFNLFISF